MAVAVVISLVCRPAPIVGHGHVRTLDSTGARYRDGRSCIGPTFFRGQILPNPADRLAKFHGSPRQNLLNSAARHHLPFMTENWESISETSLIEGWHCTTKGWYALAVSTTLRISHKLCLQHKKKIIFFKSAMKLMTWVDWNEWLVS